MAKREHLTAVQTSGGRGSRSRPLSLYSPTSMIPKGLIRVMGIPIAEIQLEDFKAVGIKDVYIITQFLENREHIANRFSDGTHRFGFRIHYSHPSDDLMNNGSGDAVLRNIERYGLRSDSIWLANDNLYELDTRRVVQQHRDLGAVVSILATRMAPRDTIRNYGIIDADAGHKVRQLIEKPDNESQIVSKLGIKDPRELDGMRVLVNTGGYLLNNDDLTQIVGKKWLTEKRRKASGEFDMSKRFIPCLIEHGYPVYVIPIDAWGDFGSTTILLDTFPQALSGMFPSINRILEARGYYHDTSENVWVHPDSYKERDKRGKTLGERMKSGRVNIGPNVFIGRNSIIHDGAHISYSDVEKYGEVGEGARLERVYLFPYCSIGPFAQLGDCALGLEVRVESSRDVQTYINGRSVIGPSIRIPKGTRLDGVVINPGYVFKNEGKTHSHVTLNPSRKQSAMLVEGYR